MRLARIKDDAVELSFKYDGDLVKWIKESFSYLHRDWDPEEKCWRIDLNTETAPGLRTFILRHMPECEDALEQVCKVGGFAFKNRTFEKTQSFVESHATDAEINVPGLKGELMPFQRAGTAYMIKKRCCFNGDEMGLGKGLQAIAAVKCLNAFPCFYITKASLKDNMCREWVKWLPDVNVTQNVKEFILALRRGNIRFDVLVINYEQLNKFKELLLEVPWKAAVADESHMISNSKAIRTKVAKEIVKKTKPDVRFALTGTPLDNKPVQLWSQMEWLGIASHFKSWYHYVTRYCEGYQGNFGWDTTGASHTEELYHRLRDIGFIRRLKAEVMKDLPAKTPVPIFVPLSNRSEYNARRREIMAEIDEGNPIAALQRLQVLAEITARGKMEAFREWLEDFRETRKKLITFAHHVTVQHEALAEMRKLGPVAYTREGRPQDAVDNFQNNPETWGICCSLEADHAGHTLTKASDVAFLQMGFRPTVIDQAGDRAHRIGQKDNVTCYFFIAEDTVEEEVWNLHYKKRAVVQAVADGVKMNPDDYNLRELVRKLRG